MSIQIARQVAPADINKTCDIIAEAVMLSMRPKRKVLGIVSLSNNQLNVFSSDAENDCSETIVNTWQSLHFNPCPNISVQILPSDESQLDLRGADDTGIAWGYATTDTPEFLPIPYMIATKILQKLHNSSSSLVTGVGQAVVAYNPELRAVQDCSLLIEHIPSITPSDIQDMIQGFANQAASEYGIPTFPIQLNPYGPVVPQDSPFGRSGVCLDGDTVIGQSHPLDGNWGILRCGTYFARHIAKECVRRGYATQCKIGLSFIQGETIPSAMSVYTYNTERSQDIFSQIQSEWGLTPVSQIMDMYHYPSHPMILGHFTSSDYQWEM